MYDVKELNVWNEKNRRAVNAYVNDPFALSRVCDAEDEIFEYYKDSPRKRTLSRRALRNLHTREQVNVIIDWDAA